MEVKTGPVEGKPEGRYRDGVEGQGEGGEIFIY